MVVTRTRINHCHRFWFVKSCASAELSMPSLESVKFGGDADNYIGMGIHVSLLKRRIIKKNGEKVLQLSCK